MKRERINGNFLLVEPMKAEEMGKDGCKLAIRYSFVDTMYGGMLIASTSKGVCYLAFVTNGQEAVLKELKQLFPRATYISGTDAFQEKAKAALTMEDKVIETVPLHLKGTDFQLSVWNELLKIPVGEVTSYGKIASALQKPKAYRAVGTAIGDNPVSVLIPCHRVLRTDGALGGYHWGIEKKVLLLEQEKQYAE